MVGVYQASLRLFRRSSTLVIPLVPFSATTLQPCRVSLAFASRGQILSKTDQTTRYPTASDGLILTGFSQDFAYIDPTFDIWASQLARNNQPERFGDLPTGYLTWANASSNQRTFLYPGFFDPGLLLFSESTKQPFTTGEVLTLGGSPPTAPEFKGPVQVLTGGESQTVLPDAPPLICRRRGLHLLRWRLHPHQ